MANCFKKIYQPVSRILYPGKPGRLSFIWPLHYCNDLAAYPSASGEPPSSAGIRGITAHKVYPINALLQKPVSSYLTFSPLPSEALATQGSYSLWHFLLFATLSLLKKTNSRLFTGVLLFAVRTFLSDKIGTITRLIEGKGNSIFCYIALA